MGGVRRSALYINQLKTTMRWCAAAHPTSTAKIVGNIFVCQGNEQLTKSINIFVVGNIFVCQGNEQRTTDKKY